MNGRPHLDDNLPLLPCGF